MKYCPSCGNELSDEVLFCEFCGTPQQVMPQQTEQQVQASQQVEEVVQKQTEKKQKKGSKKTLIIAIVLILVAALGVGGFFLIKALTKSPQEKALDQYFEAVNNKDKEAVCDMAYDTKENTSNYMFFVQSLGFWPSYVSRNDILNADQDVMEVYYKELGYKGSTIEELRENFREDINGDADILLNGLKVSYELEELKKAEDCEIGYYKNGLTFVEVDDIEKEIEEKYDIDVSDVYVAKMKITWEYNGHKYGNNDKLMDVVDKKGDIFSRNMQDMNDQLDDMDYYMVIYKCDGKYYLLDYRIMSWNNTWKIEM